MKKVLIINTTLNKGGAARVACGLFENLNSDFDVFFAYGRGVKSPIAKTFYFGNKLEMLIHIFLVRFFGLEGFGSYFSTKKLINFIRREKFDLINLHNIHGYYLNFFTLIKFIQKENIAVVWTFHDEWPITWLPGHSLGCEHCKMGTGKCTNAYSYPKNYFPIFAKFMLKKKKETFLNNWNPSIVCPSNWLQENIRNSFMSKFNIKVINNGIDTELFKPAINKNFLRIKHNLPLNKKIIVFSASNLNDKSKGIDCIISMAKKLSCKDYLFLGVGTGKIKGINNILTTGYIYNRAEFAEIYSLADLFCFVSAVETFFLSAVEALSCGIPVIGYDIPAVREIISKDVGVLVEAGNEKKLIQAIINLFENEQKISDKENNRRKLVLDNYSQELFLKNYSNLFNEILK